MDDEGYEFWEDVYFKGNYYTTLSKVCTFWKEKKNYDLLDKSYLFLYQCGAVSADPDEIEFKTLEQAIKTYIQESLSRASLTLEKCKPHIL